MPFYYFLIEQRKVVVWCRKSGGAASGGVARWGGFASQQAPLSLPEPRLERCVSVRRLFERLGARRFSCCADACSACVDCPGVRSSLLQLSVYLSVHSCRKYVLVVIPSFYLSPFSRSIPSTVVCIAPATHAKASWILRFDF